MKKLIALAVAVCSAAVVWAEQLDHWEVDGSTITDGEWTFNINLRADIVPGTEDVHVLNIMACKKAPDHLAVLDFSKPINMPTKHAIRDFVPFGGDLMTTEERAMLQHLRLPKQEYGFTIRGFQNCVNLETVTPFLPSNCTSIIRGAFNGCIKLSSPLKYNGSANFANWELFQNTAIPSIDLSESSVTQIDRACFNGCKSLKTVKLPPTLTTLAGGVLPFNDCTALELVEFNSVPGSLSAFSGCTALKEVRFYHCAPGAVSAGIYNKLNQDITTYLVLDDAETDNIAAWAALTSGGELSDDATWAETYAGSTALMSKRPLLRFSVKHVSLAAGQDGGVIAGRPGTFIVSRAEGDSLGGSVVVNYTITGGTAEEGVHFKPLSGVAEIHAGERSGTIEVPLLYFGYVGTETLTVKLAEGGYEIVEGEDEATISLSTEALRTVSIAKGEDADEGTGKVGYFVVSRGEGDPIGSVIEVPLSFGGTAIAGQTYQKAKELATIPADERSVKVLVIPYDDQSVLEDTTVEATVLPGGYGIETDSATVTVKNGETYGGWKIGDNYMTDGTWKFTVSLRGTTFADDPSTFELWLQACTVYPAEVSKVDFSKAIQNVANNSNVKGRIYAISSMNPGFASSVNGVLQEAGKVVGSVVLPDEGHGYAIGDNAFNRLPNLTSITPFLPKSCVSVGSGSFIGYKGSTDLVFYGKTIGSGNSAWSTFEGCVITNADLSASTCTRLYRYCFKDCTALKTVLLPPTIEAFGAPDGDMNLENRPPFSGCSNVKLVFSGSTLPTIRMEGQYGGGETAVSAIEFSSALTTLPDEAFKFYPNLTEIKFHGAKPETVGADIFTGLKKDNQLTVYVPRSKVATWKPVATDGIIGRTRGEWVSGTVQQIRTWADDHPGLLLLIR